MQALKGIIDDQINALLTGVGHNLRLILNHIMKLFKLRKLRNFLSQILLNLLLIFYQKLISFRIARNENGVLWWERNYLLFGYKIILERCADYKFTNCSQLIFLS